MKKLLFSLILLFSLSFADVIQIEKDVANHAFVGASLTKVVDAITKDDGLTFWIMTVIFIGKELLDFDKTGFSLNDLTYDYFGYGLIKFELEI
jgi:hypothetical protein